VRSLQCSDAALRGTAISRSVVPTRSRVPRRLGLGHPRRRSRSPSSHGASQGARRGSSPHWPGPSSPGADGLRVSVERSPSGLWRRTGNAVRGNPSRVRIPPSPPLPVELRRGGVNSPGRARRGTSGALYLQSAPAGLNPLPRSPSSNAARRCDVEDRVPRIGEPRTVSGPEGSSTKRSSSGAAARPDPSRPSRWARGRSGRRRVHGTSFPLALDRRTR
jgi:hypothetical protein